MTMSEALTLEQIPVLSDKLTPLQRTLAESYQRVFIRGNRMDDLLIFSSMINEIAESPKLAWNIGVDYAECQSDRQLKALQESEDKLTEKLRESQEAKEQLDGRYRAIIAVINKYFGQEAPFEVDGDAAQFFDDYIQNAEQVAGSLEITSTGQGKYDALQSEFRPKLEPIFGTLAQSQSIEDCFRNLIARYYDYEKSFKKSREILASVLGEEQTSSVPLEDAVLLLKARLSGANSRIHQLEELIRQKDSPAKDVSSPDNEVNSPVNEAQRPTAVVQVQDTPRQAQDKRNPFLKVDGIYQFQSQNPGVAWIALSNFDIPRPLLKSMLLMAVGETNTWAEICKTLSVNSDVAKDIQRGFAHLINKLRTRSAGTVEIEEALDKKPVAHMLEVVS